MTDPAPRLRLLLVEGQTALRHALVRRLEALPTVEVVAAALNGLTALPRVDSQRPDLVLVDLAVDFAAGCELLTVLHRAGAPIRRVALVPAARHAEVLPLLAAWGHTELVQRPEGEDVEGVADGMLEQFKVLLGRCTVRRAAVAVPATAARAGCTRAPSVVGIGVSTGGPRALAEVLPKLAADFPLPILVVQHMPPKFTANLAESLDRQCALRVREAHDGDRVVRGEILIAPGGKHMRVITRDGVEVVQLTEDPPECSCRPSVDYLFRSLRAVYGGRVLAVVLTGMGEDGWAGSRLLREAGACLLAQDEATSTVYGMPRGPIETGIARATPLGEIAAAIESAARGLVCS